MLALKALLIDNIIFNDLQTPFIKLPFLNDFARLVFLIRKIPLKTHSSNMLGLIFLWIYFDILTYLLRQVHFAESALAQQTITINNEFT